MTTDRDDRSALEACRFVTERLAVAPWHDAADRLGLQLDLVVTDLLTPATTSHLPDGWRGAFDRVRAADWIRERDAESPTLLVVDADSRAVAGLLILQELGIGGNPRRTEVRIGYIIEESEWGRGYATELVRGLVEWTREHPSIGAIAGGVGPDNPASVRVLERNGFVAEEHQGDEQIHRLRVAR